MGIFNNIKNAFKTPKGTYMFGNTWIEINDTTRTISFHAGVTKKQEFLIDTVTDFTLEQKGLKKYINVFSGGTIAYNYEATLAKEGKFSECKKYFLSLKQTESMGTTDIPDQIKKLSDLMKEGILTEEEFNKKKSDLLKQM